MDRLKEIVENSNTKAGKAFDIAIQVLIVTSIISFSIETLPNLTDKQLYILKVIETFCVIIFTIEYLLRLYLAHKKLKFIFSFFGIIDLLAILPFYITTGLDLRAIRAFRLLRLFRILKLARYSEAIKRCNMAFKSIKEELVLFLSLSIVVLYLSAVGIYYFESTAQPDIFSSIFHSLWWAVATLTTVGYGDVFPITIGGKVFTFFVLFIGLGLIAVPAGLIASAFSNSNVNDDSKD